MITFRCDYCGEEMEAPASLEGEDVECPACKHTVVVPSPATEGTGRAKATSSLGLCFNCGNDIPSRATRCPFCQKSLRADQRQESQEGGRGSAGTNGPPPLEPADPTKFGKPVVK